MKRDLPIERKALYNLIRMQWVQDPDPRIEPWQIENLRDLSPDEIFRRLKEKEIVLDKHSFLTYAEPHPAPEDLTDSLIGGRDISPEEADAIYLLIFELWRRYLPEKQSLSVFADHLDHLIWAYDAGTISDTTELQDDVATLMQTLEENTDEGNDPIDVFETISCHLANDLESFIYDYISDQIEQGDYNYASELIDGCIDYVTDLKWFNLLKARLMALSDPKGSIELIKELISESHSEPDLEFVFELMDVLVEIGNDDLFYPLVKEASHLLKIEADLQELLVICLDYFQRQDRDEIAYEVDTLINQRPPKTPMEPLTPNDPSLKKLLSVLNLG
jgi:hypothetical protein